MRCDQFNQGRRNGIKWAVTWLHKLSAEMNDPHAKQVLNMAAFNMGHEAKQPHECDCYPWPDQCPYCGGQPAQARS